MTADLLPLYDEERSCPACDYAGVGTAYVSGSYQCDCHASHTRHMHRRCRRCKYSWPEMALDDPRRSKGDA